MSFYQKIVNVSSINTNFLEICTDSIAITADQIDAYTMSIVDANLKQAFVVDMMLILNFMEETETQKDDILELLQVIFDLLDYNPDELTEVIEFARIVYEKNTEKYDEFINKSKFIIFENYISYITSFKSGIIVNNEKYLYIICKDKEKLSDAEVSSLSITHIRKKIFIDNISLEECKLKLINCHEVTIINSEFRNTIFFHIVGCQNVNIKKCEFNRVLFLAKNGYKEPLSHIELDKMINYIPNEVVNFIFEGNKEIRIMDCIFLNIDQQKKCMHKEFIASSPSGGFIKSFSPGGVTYYIVLEETDGYYEHSSSKTSYGLPAIFFRDNVIYIENSKFINILDFIYPLYFTKTNTLVISDSKYYNCKGKYFASLFDKREIILCNDAEIRSQFVEILDYIII